MQKTDIFLSELKVLARSLMPERLVCGREMLDIYRDDWITAKMQDGNLLQTGVRGCFEQADHIQEVFVDGVTTEMDNASVFSLLEVFLCRVTRLLDEADKYGLFLQGKFDNSIMQKLDAYVESCEKKGISFDIFDEKHPFLQSAQIPAKVSPSAVSILDAVMLSGNNSVFHAGSMTNGKNIENQYVMTKRQYAASVIRNCQFRIASGGGYSPSGLCSGQPPLYLIPEGRNLFETLVMSLPCYDSKETSEKDLPLWEQPELPVDVPKLITDHALGYCAATFLPTVGMHYGTVEGDAVSTVYTWNTAELYKGFGKEYKAHIPSDSGNMDVALEQCTNFLVFDNKKGNKSVCTFSADRDMLLDLFRFDIKDLSRRFRYFGYNSLEAAKFIQTVKNDIGGDVPDKIPCKIFGLRMLKKGEPQPAQMMAKVELPTSVMANEKAYKECADFVQKLDRMVRELRYVLFRLDMDMTYDKGQDGADKTKQIDDGHVKENITQMTKQYADYLHDRCINGWLLKIADSNDDQKVHEEYLEDAFQEALRIYDQYPVLDRNYIRKIQWKGLLDYRLRKAIGND